MNNEEEILELNVEVIESEHDARCKLAEIEIALLKADSDLVGAFEKYKQEQTAIEFMNTVRLLLKGNQ